MGDSLIDIRSRETELQRREFKSQQDAKVQDAEKRMLEARTRLEAALDGVSKAREAWSVAVRGSSFYNPASPAR
eukprot:NODE_5087_length_324_cov_226.010909_g4476_i0.p1 GENE.NODE_5087_length_324_cov_226.010909_g4476_i0~~NODE_5087_length_324_cov_226.010909_g4476_i0.p1  ORF type:complete len:74 (+),score=8.64 NODE_5087_length_324_cov_226.010909_g4476_i0:29-250(+)